MMHVATQIEKANTRIRLIMERNQKCIFCNKSWMNKYLDYKRIKCIEDGSNHFHFLSNSILNHDKKIRLLRKTFVMLFRHKINEITEISKMISRKWNMWDNMLFMISWEDVKAENQGRANAYTNLGNLSILEDLTFFILLS